MQFFELLQNLNIDCDYLDIAYKLISYIQNDTFKISLHINKIPFLKGCETLVSSYKK